MSISVGDIAPDFTLLNQAGKPVQLYALLENKSVVLYFYPKDDTTVCTKEACGFRDAYDAFVEAGAEVVGVSSDTVEEHQRFAGKYNLSFMLVSDEGGKVRKLYGVPKSLGFLAGRVTYVIDQNRTVRHVFNSQLNAERHVSEAIDVLRKIGKRDAGTKG